MPLKSLMGTAPVDGEVLIEPQWASRVLANMRMLYKLCYPSGCYNSGELGNKEPQVRG